MTSQQLAQCYIDNGFKLHRDINIIMHYIRNLAPEITESQVLARWDELAGDELQW